MEKEVLLVWECDAWLSKDSRVLMGVFECFGDAIENILAEMRDNNAFDEDHEDEDGARRMLESQYQTQGYETNYWIQSATLNEWGEI